MAPIWLLFNPQKKKNQQGFGLILLARCFLSPCRLEDECELRHSDPPTEPKAGSPSAHFNCEMDSDGFLVTCRPRRWSRRPARMQTLPEVRARTANERAIEFDDILPSYPPLPPGPSVCHTFSNIFVMLFYVIAMTYNRQGQSCNKNLIFLLLKFYEVQECSGFLMVHSSFSLSISFLCICLCQLIHFIAL